MFKNHLIIAFRNIFKYKVHSVINILGFSIALAVVFLLSLYVYTEISADKFHKNYGNIYRLQKSESAGLAPQFADILSENFPEVEKVTRIISAPRIVLNYNKPLYVNNIISVDNTFFDIFTFKAIAGDIKTALKEPASIVLIEREAKRLFGDENPIGKTVQFNSKQLLTVKAVIENIPDNSSFNFSGVIPIDFLKQIRGKDFNEISNANFGHYFLCPNQINTKNFAVKIKTYFNEKFPGWNRDDKYEVIPFSEIYFAYTVRDSCRHGYPPLLLLLAGIGLLILIIAIFNFINLSIAKSAKRSLEIGVRKVLGASRKMLVGQFLTEAVIISLIAIGISVTFVELLVPEFNQLFNTSISLGLIKLPWLLVFFISSGIVLGLLAGIYPAFYLTSFNPVRAIKGEKKLGSKAGTFKKGLLVFQFVVSVILIICTLVIAKQRFFMQRQDLGFCKENTLVLADINDMSEGFKQELLHYPNIEKLAISTSTPGYVNFITDTQWNYKGAEKNIRFFYFDVDHNYLPLMGFELKQGRFFADKLDNGRRVCIINESAITEFGIDNPYEAFFDIFRDGKNSSPAQVVGVVKNFNQESLHNKIEPFIFFYDPNPKSGLISLKLVSNNVKSIKQTIGYIEEIWNKYYSDIPFTYNFLDDQLDKLYQFEARFEKIFIFFSILAIVIACLGLFGLVSFMTEQLTKEIGIRKVLGASVTGIVGMLTKDFTKLVLFANIIAWPIAYFAMDKLLQYFAYRINLDWWIFLLAGVLALVIALLTVSYQAIRAAIANPVETLRYE